MSPHYNMILKGRKLAKLIGNGYRLLGVDPGYLFVSDKFPRHSLDLPDGLFMVLAWTIARSL